MRSHATPVEYRLSPSVNDAELNDLFRTAWAQHERRAFQPILSRSLVYVCAFEGRQLIGFVNVAWDGGVHGFLLDTTVAPDYQRRGIGTELVRHAARAAAQAGLEWLHVDYAQHLDRFYRGCGFGPTMAGLLRLPAANT